MSVVLSSCHILKFEIAVFITAVFVYGRGSLVGCHYMYLECF